MFVLNFRFSGQKNRNSSVSRLQFLSFLQNEHVSRPQIYMQALLGPATNGLQIEFVHLTVATYSFPLTVKDIEITSPGPEL